MSIPILKISPKISFILVTIFLSLVLIGLRWCFYEGKIRLNYPSSKQFPIQGIDISHHQGHILWEEIDKNKVQFVFAKATEGQNFVDPRFQENLSNATKYGIPISGYHFFTFCRTGEEQANNYISHTPKEDISLPPVIDLEFGGNCQQKISDEQLISEITYFIQIVEKNYQQKVIIYTTQEFYQQHIFDKFLNNPIWIRDIYKQPKLSKGNRSWMFWQYANRGKLDGIDGFIDLNVFFADRETFNKLFPEK